jgi:Protein of unknown function (DUF3237)
MTASLSGELPEVLTTVRTRPLFRLQQKVPPLHVVGQTPGAFRRIGVIASESFVGDRLSGEVLAGGNDWQSVRGDGCTKLDVRLMLQETVRKVGVRRLGKPLEDCRVTRCIENVGAVGFCGADDGAEAGACFDTHPHRKPLVTFRKITLGRKLRSETLLVYATSRLVANANRQVQSRKCTCAVWAPAGRSGPKPEPCLRASSPCRIGGRRGTRHGRKSICLPWALAEAVEHHGCPAGVSTRARDGPDGFLDV